MYDEYDNYYGNREANDSISTGTDANSFGRNSANDSYGARDTYSNSGSTDAYGAGNGADSYSTGNTDSFGYGGGADSYGYGGGNDAYNNGGAYGGSSYNATDSYSANNTYNNGYSQGGTNSSFGGANVNGNYGGYGSSNYGESDDDILAQIDEFRNKAQRLQTMINEREQQAGNMGGSQGGVSPAFTRDLERKMESINAALNGITGRLSQQDGTLSSIDSKISAQDSTLTGIVNRLSSQDTTLSGIESKLEEGVTVSTPEVAQAVPEAVPETPAAPSFPIPPSAEETADTDGLTKQLEEAIQSLDKLSKELDSTKSEISEKIHSENVKVYRNLNDTLKENDRSEDNKAEIIKKIKGVKTSANLAFIFAIFDFAGIGALVYLMLRMTGIL